MVPHEAAADQAVVWVGADEAPATGLVVVTSAGVVALGAWQVFPHSGQTRLWFQRVTLVGLEPRAAYHTQLRRDGEVLAESTVRTLPADIPSPGARPFTVLLASCFCARSDQEGSLNVTFLNLPQKPDVKILCGDQVYLDEPWQAYNLSNVELTPGLSSASTCTEAIWQAAKWWGTYYDRVSTHAESAAARPVAPWGSYAIRQREASARQF